jgi:hypothetical protein
MGSAPRVPCVGNTASPPRCRTQHIACHTASSVPHTAYAYYPVYGRAAHGSQRLAGGSYPTFIDAIRDLDDPLCMVSERAPPLS